MEITRKHRSPLIVSVMGGVVLLSAALGIWAYTPDLPRAELERRYGDPADRDVAVAGLRVHVRDTGPRSAPAIVMLHGFGSSLQTWDDWASALSLRYRVIRYDLPGFGLTGPDPTGDYSERRGMAVLLGVMDRLGVVQATLIGNSMGGGLAWAFAGQFPERVDKLVLISPAGFASPGFDYGRPAKVPAMLSLTPYVLPKALVKMSLRPAYADPVRLTPARVARYWAMMRAPGVRKAMLARLRQTVLVDPRPILAKIRAPTLLLWGEKDAMIPVSNAQDYLRAMPTATLVEMPNLGHVPMEEAPARSLAPVEAFLAKP